MNPFAQGLRIRGLVFRGLGFLSKWFRGLLNAARRPPRPGPMLGEGGRGGGEANIGFTGRAEVVFFFFLLLRPRRVFLHAMW